MIEDTSSLKKRLSRWEYKRTCENLNTRLESDLVDFMLVEILPDGSFHNYDENDIALDFTKVNNRWQPIKVKLQVRNRTNQELHAALCWFSPEYGVHVMSNTSVIPGPDWLTLYGDKENDCIYLPNDINMEIDFYKLFISTEKIANDLLEENDINEIDRRILFNGHSELNNINRSVESPDIIPWELPSDWFCKILTCTVVRLQAHVSPQDTTLAEGRMIIKGHPAFHANICLYETTSHTRSLKREILTGLFSNQKHPVLDLSENTNTPSTRAYRGISSPVESVLELSDIHHSESLKDDPLVIELDTLLSEDEFLLPITFDGNYFLPVGEFFKNENGTPTVRIHHIPETYVPKRRSLGKALRLCFYKLALNRDNVNRLCWVEYTGDNKIVRHRDGVKEKVEKAERIILLVHGIIGDTKVMAKGLKLAVDDNNNCIADQFDLVLAYDYENLNTPIHETAGQLKNALRDIGIHELQQKKITILSHSMGGLLSRWLIEYEGGKGFVNHLVMAGTPNNGSVFGNICDYKNIVITSLTLSLNFFKPLIAHAGALLFALNQSDNLFVCLNQMKVDSSFIRGLELTDDPHVKYTILAGDISLYKIKNKGYFSALIDKIETSVGKLAYGDVPNDIAVSVASIKNVEEKRMPSPEMVDLVCHHLNYFTESVSLNALQATLVPGK